MKHGWLPPLLRQAAEPKPSGPINKREHLHIALLPVLFVGGYEGRDEDHFIATEN